MISKIHSGMMRCVNFLKVGSCFSLSTFLFSLLITGCIENDIPYPILSGDIVEMSVEDEVEVTIDKNRRVVDVVVGDSADLSRLLINKLILSDGAIMQVGSECCADKEHFPTTSFESLDSLDADAYTRIDLLKEGKILVSTYQHYIWTIRASHRIEREVIMENQIGNAVIDEVNHNVVVYVAPTQDLSAVHVTSLSLGGKHGNVMPDATEHETYDFSSPQTFYVQYLFAKESEPWRVFVYHASAAQMAASVSVFARTVSATISGAIQSGKSPRIEYKRHADTEWTVLEADAINLKGTTYSADMTSLKPATQYNYRVFVDDEQQTVGAFTTSEAIPLENGDMESWYQDGKLWNPWAKGGVSFWDTGNRGATTVGDSNSQPTNDTPSGKGLAASLESKYIVLKFAAGNIFTGTYVRTDGTNGVLDFGRPFTSFPTALKFKYKYTSMPINKVGDHDYDHLKGTPDIGTVYVVLADWDAPFTIKTRTSERSLLDTANDPHIIAYSCYEISETNTTFKEITMPINYRVFDRTPKYIIVCASSSKYGDYFTGGEGSKMVIDDFELVY